MLNKYLELQIGGEFAFGGIFNANDADQNEIYNKWNELVLPAIQQIMQLPENRKQPILQAVIIQEVPPHIIKDIVLHCTESVNSVDGLGRYPIDVAIERGLSWDDGTEEIVVAFAAAQQSTAIIVGAKHGLRWENGMRSLFEDSDENDVESKDGKTGLFASMLAAVGGKYGYDLGTVFRLIQASPGCLISQSMMSPV